MLGFHASVVKQRLNEAVGCHISGVARWAALSLRGAAAGQTRIHLRVHPKGTD